MARRESWSSPLDRCTPTSTNVAIRERIGSKPPNALYIEKLDLDSYWDRVREAGARIADPLAPRPWGQREFTVEAAAGNWLTFWSKV